jgi:anti-sigma regulatory factor (Ser/Thr protein kinase)
MTDQVFPCELQSVGEFRRLVGRVLAGLPTEVVEGGRVTASELGANALRHSRSGLSGGKWIGKVEIGVDAVLIEVTDQGATDTTPADVDPDEHGRGLILCRAFGQLSTEITETGGRRTRVRIPLAAAGAEESR